MNEKIIFNFLNDAILNFKHGVLMDKKIHIILEFWARNVWLVFLSFSNIVFFDGGSIKIGVKNYGDFYGLSFGAGGIYISLSESD